MPRLACRRRSVLPESFTDDARQPLWIPALTFYNSSNRIRTLHHHQRGIAIGEPIVTVWMVLPRWQLRWPRICFTSKTVMPLKPRVSIMPILSSLVAQQVVIITTPCSDTIGNKVGIMITLCSHKHLLCYLSESLSWLSIWSRLVVLP